MENGYDEPQIASQLEVHTWLWSMRDLACQGQGRRPKASVVSKRAGTRLRGRPPKIASEVHVCEKSLKRRDSELDNRCGHNGWEAGRTTIYEFLYEAYEDRMFSVQGDLGNETLWELERRNGYSLGTPASVRAWSWPGPRAG